jgi:hypothetical protein
MITKKGWETRRKNGNGTAWNKGKKGIQVAWNKGKSLKDYPNMGFKKGHKVFTSKEGYKKGGGKRMGVNHHNWKGGITPIKNQIYYSYKYRQWRSDVFTRDNFTCQWCGDKRYLEAHHIKEYNKILQENNIKTFEDAEKCEELWNINNGLTLCKECHKKTKNYGEKAKIKFVKYTA